MGTQPGPLALGLAGLLGEEEKAVIARLGPPHVDRRAGKDRWLVYRAASWSLRVRIRADTPRTAGRARSWTLSFASGYPSLRKALDAFGLKVAEPDGGQLADRDAEPPLQEGLIRRVLSEGGVTHSLTALVRGGRIQGVTAFDEPPEWLDGTEGGAG